MLVYRVANHANHDGSLCRINRFERLGNKRRGNVGRFTQIEKERPRSATRSQGYRPNMFLFDHAIDLSVSRAIAIVCSMSSSE